MNLRRFFAVFLTTGVLAAMAAGASGNDDPHGSSGGEIFFPWVPNGEVIGDFGPRTGEITVQNLDHSFGEIEFHVGDASGDPAMTSSLSPNGSTTFTADHLQIPEPGASVLVRSVPIDDDYPVNITAVIKTVSEAPVVDDNSIALQSDTDSVQQDDEADSNGGGPPANNPGRGRGPSGDGPPGGPPEDGPDLPDQANPNAHSNVPGADDDEPIEEDRVLIDGYNGLAEDDLALHTVLPIVQNGSGWDTILRIAAPYAPVDDSLEVTLTFYAEGSAEPAFVWSFENDSGEAVSIALSDTELGDFTGAVVIGTSHPAGAMAERIHADNARLLTKVARTSGSGDYEQHAPLPVGSGLGWDTRLSVVNSSNSTHTIWAEIYDVNGDLAFTLEFTQLESNEMAVQLFSELEWDYSLVAVRLVGDDSFHAVVDQVNGAGEAATFETDTPAAGPGEQLAAPLVEKGFSTTGAGTFSGIHLFNPTEEFVSAEVRFFNPAGGLVQATDTNPIPVMLGPAEVATVITANLALMPEGFRGTAVIDVVSETGRITGVASNISYDEPGDGMAVFNLVRVGDEAPAPQPASIELESFEDEVVIGFDYDLLATVLDEFGNPIADVEVVFEVAGANEGIIGTNDPDADGDNTGVTNANGEVWFTYAGTEAGLDEITATVPGTNLLNSVGVHWFHDATGEPVATTFTVEPVSATLTVGQTHEIVVTVYDQFGDPFEGANVLAEIAEGPNTDLGLSVFETDAEGSAFFIYTSDLEGTDWIEVTVQELDGAQTATVTWWDKLAD